MKMKLKMALVGGSMLLMFGAVGAMETGPELLGPLCVVAVAAVMGFLGVMVNAEE